MENDLYRAREVVGPRRLLREAPERESIRPALKEVGATGYLPLDTSPAAGAEGGRINQWRMEKLDKKWNASPFFFGCRRVGIVNVQPSVGI
jgi:hypothetical protein